MTRPLLVIWNHPYSNYIIVSSMTTQKHISSNFEIRSGSYASFDALIMDKNKIFTSFNGKIFDSVDEKTMSQFLTEFQKRSKSYALLMGKISEYQLIANNREMNIKNKLIEELMKSK